MFTNHKSSILNPVRAIALSGLAILAMAVPPTPAAAQGIFDLFFGGPRRSASPTASAYADPNVNPFRSNSGEPRERRSESGYSGGGGAYCVRLCDGRHFPIQRLSGVTPAQTCSSFCPATRTKVFSGGSIDRAVASDGTRYSDLPTAFTYRDRLVADYTCNGKDPVGLVTADAADDPTLRPGDIVVTNSGFVAYTGGRRNAEFTPVESYASGELRNRLAGVKIVPRNATPVPEQAASPAPSADRRVQLGR